MKKVAVVILIFILLAIAPQVGNLYDVIRDNTPVVVATVNNALASISNTLSNTFASIGIAIPAIASASQTQAAQASATPSPLTEATPTPTPTPAPSATPAPLPTPAPSPTATPQVNLFGTISGQTYTNDAAGLQFDFPQGYTAYDQQAIREDIVKNSPALTDAYSDSERFNAMVQAGQIPVFAASKHPYDYDKGFNSKIIVNISQLKEQFSLKDLANYMKESFSQTDGYTNVKNPQSVTINGNQAYLITATANEQKIKVNTKIYLLQNNNWLITITLGSISTTEMNEMVKALQTIKITAFASEKVDAGTVSGQAYSNNTGGFTLNFPAGYTATTDPAAIKKYNLEVFEASKSIYNDPDTIQKSIEEGSSSTLFVAYRNPKGYKAGFNNEINISMISLNGLKGSAQDYAAIAQEAILALSDKIEVSNPEAVEIGGLQGVVLLSSYKIGSYTVSDQDIFFMKNGYIVSVDFTAVDEAGKSELTQAFKTFKILTGT